MKSNIDITNDLAIPLKDLSAEWTLYTFKKRYKQKALDSYEMYSISTLNFPVIYSDIYEYTLKHYLNKMDTCLYSAEMPKDKIGYIDLTTNDNILKNSLTLFEECKNNSVLFNSKDFSLHGYMLECKIDGNTYLQIYCSANPIKNYKHRYSIVFNKLNEITNPILSINTSCDCIILHDYALFFTNRAESIFDLEKHYKALASKCLNQLGQNNIIENFDSFKAYASTWPRAAKFESFDFQRIKSFSELSTQMKKNILNPFSIALNEQGAIVSNSPESHEQVLNFMCKKLMTDFNDDGYEVAYSKKINLQ